MYQFTNAARISGMTDQDLRTVLKLSGGSKKYANALARAQEAPSWRIGNTFMKGAVKRARMLIDRETAQEFKERKRFIRQIARDLQ